MGKHPQTLKNWIYKGDLKASKVGNAYQIAESELKRLRGIDSQQQEGRE